MNPIDFLAFTHVYWDFAKLGMLISPCLLKWGYSYMRGMRVYGAKLCA